MYTWNVPFQISKYATGWGRGGNTDVCPGRQIPSRRHCVQDWTVYAVIGCKLKQNANEGCNSYSTVVQVLQDLFYCLFYFTCDRPITQKRSGQAKYDVCHRRTTGYYWHASTRQVSSLVDISTAAFLLSPASRDTLTYSRFSPSQWHR